MVDWTSAMEQTFEYYIVDPGTWKDKSKLDTVVSSTINMDCESETLGTASIDITGHIEECYIRIYMITIQNDVREKHPLGTFIVQTPSSNFDGKVETMSLDAYTPLMELKEKPVPIGYYIPKGTNIMDIAYRLTRENARAPVVNVGCSVTLQYDFVADINDTWLSFLSDLISNAKYEYSLDELGRILFAPKQDTASLQPVKTYDDGNSSILYPEFDIDQDLFGVPNVVEVLYSNGNTFYYSRVVNSDPNSPTSTVRRGREIPYRDTEPSIVGNPTQAQIDEYADQLLRALSSFEYTITYKHGYCQTRVNDCVRLNYTRAKLTDIKAKVISQSIKCEPGCPVSEKAVFTKKLWR